MGNISIGGAIERANNFPDRVSSLSENGAKIVSSNAEYVWIRDFTTNYFWKNRCTFLFGCSDLITESDIGRVIYL